MDTSETIMRTSRFIDASYPWAMQPELVLRRRIDKVTTELGEVFEALEMLTGENVRKAVENTDDTQLREDLAYELLDVAMAALCAYEHVTGNEGKAMLQFEQHAAFVAQRLGV